MTDRLLNRSHETYSTLLHNFAYYIKLIALAPSSRSKGAMSIRDVRRKFESEAAEYDETRFVWIQGYLGRMEKKYISRFVSHGAILDIGAGTGRNISLLTKVSSELVALDLSRKMLVKAGGTSRNAEFLLADAHKLCFQDGIFHCIVCSRTIKFFEVKSALREMNRVLKKEGRLLIIVETNDFLSKILLTLIPGAINFLYTSFSIADIVRLLEQSGFRILSRIKLASLPYLFYDAPYPIIRLLKLVDKMLKVGHIWFIACMSDER